MNVQRVTNILWLPCSTVKTVFNKTAETAKKIFNFFSFEQILTKKTRIYTVLTLGMLLTTVSATKQHSAVYLSKKCCGEGYVLHSLLQMCTFLAQQKNESWRVGDALYYRSGKPFPHYAMRCGPCSLGVYEFVVANVKLLFNPPRFVSPPPNLFFFVKGCSFNEAELMKNATSFTPVINQEPTYE